MVGISHLQDVQANTQTQRRAEFDSITMRIGGETDSLNKRMHFSFLEKAITSHIEPGGIRDAVVKIAARTSGIIQALDFVEEKRGEDIKHFPYFRKKLMQFLVDSHWEPAYQAFYRNPVTLREFEQQFDAMRNEGAVFEGRKFKEYSEIADISNGMDILIRHVLVAKGVVLPDEELTGLPRTVAKTQNHCARVYLDVLKYKLDLASNPPKPNVVLKFAEEMGLPLDYAVMKLLNDADAEMNKIERHLDGMDSVFGIFQEVCQRIRGWDSSIGMNLLIDIAAATKRIKAVVKR